VQRSYLSSADTNVPRLPANLINKAVPLDVMAVNVKKYVQLVRKAFALFTKQEHALYDHAEVLIKAATNHEPLRIKLRTMAHDSPLGLTWDGVLDALDAALGRQTGLVPAVMNALRPFAPSKDGAAAFHDKAHITHHGVSASAAPTPVQGARPRR